MTAPTRILVVGGQRSGKSRYAEEQVTVLSPSPVYLATATAGDGEMGARIAAHRDRRGTNWRVIEEPLALAETLVTSSEAGGAVLVDCLTLWLSNLFGAGRDIDAETDRLTKTIVGLPGSVVFVSNEVGSGVIPDNALARAYADALGTLNQRVAEAADRVVLVVAGQALTIKGGTP